MERADLAGSPSSQNLMASAAGDTNILTATLPAEGGKKHELHLLMHIEGASAAPGIHKNPTGNWVVEAP